MAETQAPAAPTQDAPAAAEAPKPNGSTGTTTPAPQPPKPDGAPEKPSDAERLSELEKQTKRAAYEGMKRAQEFKRQREELSKREQALLERESKVKEAETWESSFVKDPIRFLQKRLGETWYDKLSAAKLSGAVTPDMVSLEVDDRVTALQKQLQEQSESFKKMLEERDAREERRLQEEHAAQAVNYLKTNADKYPLIHAFEVQGNINAFIQNHFAQTCRYGDDGEVIPGEVWTPEEAAGEMEKYLQARLDAAVAKKSPTATNAPNASSSPRRTLSTDLTARSTGQLPPAKDDAERRRRAFAAADQVIAQRLAAP